MKPKKNKILLYALVVVCISGCYGRTPVITTGLEGKSMPSFELLLLDSTTHFNTFSIPQGKPVVFFSFATWCPYCKAQLKDLISEIENLKDIQFLMLTTSKYSELKLFYEHYKIYDYSNIIMGIDQSYFFAGYFNTNAVPFFAIYGKDRKLKQVLKGQSSINLIKEIALSEEMN